MRDNAPRFSIIMPVYRVEQYIKKAVSSVLSQCFHDYEVLIIDDGSDDGSISVVQSMIRSHSNFRICRKENGGLASARNLGLALASGEYILFLDSDDWFMEDFFNKLDALLQRTHPDILYFNGVKDIESGTELLRSIRLEANFLTGLEYMDICIRKKEWISVVWLGAYRRSFLQEHHIRFAEGFIHEDDNFSIQCLQSAKRILYLDEKWYHYRIRADSIMKSKNAVQDYEGFLTATETSARALKENLVSEGLQWLVGRYMMSCVKYLFQLPEERIDAEKKHIETLINNLQESIQIPFLSRLQGLLTQEHISEQVAYQLWYDYIKDFST